MSSKTKTNSLKWLLIGVAVLLDLAIGAGKIALQLVHHFLRSPVIAFGAGEVELGR